MPQDSLHPKNKPKADLVIQNAASVVTCISTPADAIGRIPEAAIAITGEHIAGVGSAAEIQAQFDLRTAQVIDARRKIIAPGFIDSHTHLVFGGSRVEEYAAKMTQTPAEVRAMGIPTGIVATMAKTRAETREQLTQSALARLAEMIKHGTTTVESKSGYGLDTANELKMLQVNHDLQAQQPVDIISTFLGAHALPPDLGHDHYVDQVIYDMIPEVVTQNLAVFCDVYCDEGYFTLEDSRRILEAAREAGLQLKIHTDQYSWLGGAALAAELQVISADHLNFTPPRVMPSLAEAGVIGVLMPLIDFAVQHPHPFDVQALREAEVPLALATDLCPGCWAVSMQLVMQHATRQHGFSPEEALLASTTGGARALGLTDRGTLAPGMLADLQIWDLPTFEDVIYRLGHNAVEMVIKRGEIAYHRSETELKD
jgi:imidazolonepropionase